MRRCLHWALFSSLLLATAAGCDGDKTRARLDAGSENDDVAAASNGSGAARDAGAPDRDAADEQDASSSEMRLERPGTLPRPPSGVLPPDLRPPR